MMGTCVELGHTSIVKVINV